MRKPLLGCIATALVLLTFGATAQQSPPPVPVATPVVKEVREWDEYTGRFAAVERVEIHSRVSGYLESVHFEDGDIVKKGDLLFVIDQRPFTIALKAAEAELEQAQATLALAEKRAERGALALQRRAISGEEQDLRRQEARRNRGLVTEQQADLERARLNLEFTEVRAPINGRVSRDRVTPGNLVIGGDTGGTLLTTIVSQDPIYFYFDVSEADFLKYTRLHFDGQRVSSRDSPNPVQIRLLDEEEFVHEGHMDFVENELDAGSGTLQGRAILENPQGFLQPGQFGRLRLLGSGIYDAILIPDSAVQFDQSRRFVFVIDDEDTAERRWITVGPIIDGLRVVREGLEPNDRIVTSGFHRVRPGTVVAPQEGVIEAARAP